MSVWLSASAGTESATIVSYRDTFDVDGSIDPGWIKLHEGSEPQYGQAGGSLAQSANNSNSYKFLIRPASETMTYSQGIISRLNDSGDIKGLAFHITGATFAELTGYEVTFVNGYFDLYEWTDGASEKLYRSSSYISLDRARVMGVFCEVVSGKLNFSCYEYADVPEPPAIDSALKLLWSFQIPNTPKPQGGCGFRHNSYLAEAFSSQYFTAYTDTAVERIDSINNGTGVRSNEPITITGEFPNPVTSVDINGVNVAVDTQSLFEVTCSPIDVHSTQLSYGPCTLTLVASGTVEAATVLNPEGTNVYVVGASIDATNGLAADGGAEGDQWEVAGIAGSSSITLNADTNIVISPTASEGSVIPFWRKPPGANNWVASSVTVFTATLPRVEFIVVPGPDGQQWLSEPAGDRPGGSLPPTTNVSASFSETTAVISWSYFSTEHTRFELQYALIDRDDPQWSATITIPPGERQYTLTNLPAGTQVGARVRAANDD